MTTKHKPTTPPSRQLKTALTFKPMRGLGGGFRQEWLDTSTPRLKAGLECGAGLGNPMLTVWIQRGKDEREYFECDMREVFRNVLRELGEE